MTVINERTNKERLFPDVMESAKRNAESIRRIASQQDNHSVEQEMYG